MGEENKSKTDKLKVVFRVNHLVKANENVLFFVFVFSMVNNQIIVFITFLNLHVKQLQEIVRRKKKKDCTSAILIPHGAETHITTYRNKQNPKHITY